MFLGGTGDADQKVYTVAVQQKRLAGLGGYTVVEALEQGGMEKMDLRLSQEMGVKDFELMSAGLKVFLALAEEVGVHHKLRLRKTRARVGMAVGGPAGWSMVLGRTVSQTLVVEGGAEGVLRAPVEMVGLG
jgi:hypothetical protein